MEKQMEKDIVELLEVLDTDIVNIERDIKVLDELRKSLVTQNEQSMLRLLYVVRLSIQNRQNNETRRFRVRKRLADMLGIAVEKLTLSKLHGYIEEPYQTALAEKKNVLSQIVERFKTEHEATVFLLSDSARFNSLLLRSLISLSSTESVIYKPGKVSRADGAAFINTQY